MLTTDNLKTFKFMKEDNTAPPTPIVGDGILLHNTILTIIGPPKTGKSFLVFDLAVRIASGRPFLGSNISEKKSVLILSAEGGYYPNRDRVKLLTEGVVSEDLENIGYIPNAKFSFNQEDDVQSLIELIQETKYQVVMFDPFIRFHEADENSSSAMSGVYTALREIMDTTKTSICIVHHTGKNEHAGARGSSLITSEYDSCIALKKKRNMVEVSFDMRHVETPETKLLKFNYETNQFEIFENDRFGEIEKIISKPMIKSQIVEELKKQGLSKTPAYNLINDMAESGQLLFEGGKYRLSDTAMN